MAIPPPAKVNISKTIPVTSSVGTKIELLKLFGLSLGDVYNLNRLAIQAADMTQGGGSTGSYPEMKIGAAVMTAQGNIY